MGWRKECFPTCEGISQWRLDTWTWWKLAVTLGKVAAPLLRPSFLCESCQPEVGYEMSKTAWKTLKRIPQQKVQSAGAGSLSSWSVCEKAQPRGFSSSFHCELTKLFLNKMSHQSCFLEFIIPCPTGVSGTSKIDISVRVQCPYEVLFLPLHLTRECPQVRG